MKPAFVTNNNKVKVTVNEKDENKIHHKTITDNITEISDLLIRHKVKCHQNESTR